MLVERRISTKINYDVLRGIEIDHGLGGGGGGGEAQSNESTVSDSVKAKNQVTPVRDSLTITRTPVGNRLPSLGTRKRFSSPSTFRSYPLSMSQLKPISEQRTENPPKKRKTGEDELTMEDVVSAKLEQAVVDTGLVVEGGSREGEEEEEEEDGLDDEDMEELVYEDDPLLVESDYDDYDDYNDDNDEY